MGGNAATRSPSYWLLVLLMVFYLVMCLSVLCDWYKGFALIPLSGLKPLRYIRQPSPTNGKGIAPTIPVLHSRTLQPE